MEAFLSLPVFLALMAMAAFYFTISVPDKAALMGIGVETQNLSDVDVLKTAHNLKPWKLMEKRDLMGAVQAVQAMINASPNDLAAVYCAAMVYKTSGNVNDAFNQMRRALALAPRNNDLRLEYAKMLLESGRFDEAVSQYHLVIKQSPKAVGPRMELSHIFLNADRPADAVKELTELIEIAPSNASAHKIRGIAMARSGRAQEGMDEYLNGIVTEHGVGQPEAVKLIMGAYGDDIDKDKYKLQQQAEQNPDDAMPKLRLAEICLYADQPAEAKTYLLEARKLAPDNPEIQRSLCVALKRLGDNKQALTAFMLSVVKEQEQAKRALHPADHH